MVLLEQVGHEVIYYYVPPMNLRLIQISATRRFEPLRADRVDLGTSPSALRQPCVNTPIGLESRSTVATSADHVPAGGATPLDGRTCAFPKRTRPAVKSWVQ